MLRSEEWCEWGLVFDGDCFRATAAGTANPAGDDWVLPFSPGHEIPHGFPVHHRRGAVDRALTAGLDRLRPSDNVFVGLRIERRSDELSMRAACPARAGENLVEATARQSEFILGDLDGTLVGFWAPE